MSFSNDVKTEIVDNKPLRMRFRQAHGYGLLLFSKSFSADDICIATENEEIARLYSWFARELAGRHTPVIESAAKQRGKTLYTARIAQQSDKLRLLGALGHTDKEMNRGLFATPEQVHAFVAGAFLACGNITHPEKGYHLEFVIREPALCREFAGILEQFAPGVRGSRRRGVDILYYKECAQIEDVLAAMGASRASLAMIEVEIFKEVRNKANRATNCETANIDKLVKASTAQVEDIAFILDTKGEEWLPETLRQAALVRLAHPELSLRELAEEMPGGISRSGMHHRLDKLQKLAAKLREGLE